MLLIVMFLIAIVFPAAFWWYFFIWQDRAESEPKKSLLKVFFLGMGIAFLAGAVELTIAFVLFPDKGEEIFQIMNETSFLGLSLVIVASVIEELLKFFAIWEFIYAKRDLNQIADGFFYAVAMAIGFVVIENSQYLYLLYREETTGVFIFSSVMRAIATALMHITSAGLIGCAFGRMKFSPGHSRLIVFIALLLATILHIAFNLLVSFGLLFVAFLVTFFSFLYLLKVIRKQKSKLVWRLADAGKPAE